MTYEIEQIKSEISRGGGIAKGNLFRVILPVIPQIYINSSPNIGVAFPQNLNILCKSVTMPGKQLLTSERTIGVVTQKVVYGYANDDVTLTFMGLNNYHVRKYFEDWMGYALNNDTNEARYKTDYAKTVVIEQLDLKHNVVYGVKLEKAFPYQMLGVDFNNEANTQVDITVTMSYTKWVRTNVVRDFISGEVQDILENIIL